jgi:hypothetical protein
VIVIAPSARRSGGGTCAADQHTKRPHRTLRTLTTYPACYYACSLRRKYKRDWRRCKEGRKGGRKAGRKEGSTWSSWRSGPLAGRRLLPGARTRSSCAASAAARTA